MKEQNIALVGFMATGKTKVSKELSKICGKKVVSTDALIEEKEGRPIREIFQQSGEPYFRQLEQEVTKEVSQKSNIIIDCGGGIVLNPENVAELKKNGVVVCLVASPEVIYERIKDKISQRPVLNVDDPKARIKELLEERESCYSQADIMINTENKILKTVAQEILEAINHE